MKLITRNMITNRELRVGAAVEIHSGFADIEITKGTIIAVDAASFTIDIVAPEDGDDAERNMQSEWFAETEDEEANKATRVYLIDHLEEAIPRFTVFNTQTNMVVLRGATESDVSEYALQWLSEIQDLRVIPEQAIREIKVAVEIK